MKNDNIIPMESLEEKSGVRALVVDDDRLICMLLQGHLENMGHQVETAEDGAQGWSFLEEQYNEIDIIVVDREMPNMNGIELVKKIKSHPEMKRIPVIMATGSDEPEKIKEGLDAGVFYYLIKPIDEDILHSVFASALRDVSQDKLLNTELQKHKASFNLFKTAQFELKTLEEAEGLACCLANCFPDPARVISGLATLIMNGIEHGNLGIGFDEKSVLLEEDRWEEEMERRACLPEFQNRKIDVRFRRNDDGFYVQVTDEGQGFEWGRYLEIDPARALESHGRGIAQANAVNFDEIRYNDIGNQVTAIVYDKEDLDW